MLENGKMDGIVQSSQIGCRCFNDKSIFNYFLGVKYASFSYVTGAAERQN